MTYQEKKGLGIRCGLVDFEPVGLEVDPPQYSVFVAEGAPHLHVGSLLRGLRVLTVYHEERSLSVWRESWALIDACVDVTVIVAPPRRADYVVDLAVELDRA